MMPQLVPFYFVNSMITLLVCLGLTI
ncbi:MAG: hypothetical protein EOP34_04195 [Rickettsiales bacterium]|nr:MAG: hypothetical protein EOP34_04195 [Rickettsiales bacterium]